MLGKIPHRRDQLQGIVASLLLMILLSCTTQGREAIGKTVPEGMSRDGLIEAYRNAGKMLFVYGTGDSVAAMQYKDLLVGMSQQKSRMIVVVRSDREVTDAELHEMPLYLIGTPKNNGVLRRVLPQLPFNVTEQSLEFNRQQYGDHTTLSIGFYPNPLAPNLPLSLTTGMRETDIYQQLQKSFEQPFFWFAISGWGYQLHDAGRRKVMGFFDESDPKEWKIGKKTHWDFGHDGALKAEIDNIQYYDHQSAYSTAVGDSIGAELQQAWTDLRTMFGWDLEKEKAKIHLYPSAELKGLATGDTQAASLDERDSSLHLVVHPEHAGRSNQATNLWLIRQHLGVAKMPQLELGLSVMATPHWHRHGWSAWAKRFWEGGARLPIAEMLDAETWAHESPYLKECMSAALVTYLVKTWGAQGFLQFYQKPVPTRLTGLDAGFNGYLQALPSAAPNSTPSVASTSFQKAFNFAHEGYQVFNGYLSAEATKSIDYTAKSLHCNAVAIIPYAGMEDVHAPSWLDFSEGAGAENDESIVHCIWSARQSGISVMIKPQVWPWNDWTGEVAMQNEDDWLLFFDRYYRWIRHYAIMAELYEVETLCIGVEFSKATLQRPDDWRKMIGKLRGIYHGKMTYAANWGEEFEQCKFWDALDYVAVNCYYPISKKDNPKQKELDAGFAEVVQTVEKVALATKKPVLFTEIGFRSCTTPWANPHAEADGRKTDTTCQAACYKAMIAGLEGKDWFRGIYLWKWPAYMDDARYDPMGFTPLGKPAEQLVRDWFEKR